MNKWDDNRAWLLVLPVFVIVAFSAIIPLMTVVNYSVQDIFGPDRRVFVGTEWYQEVLFDRRLREALWRQFLFSGLALLFEMPLGVLIALAMPKRGPGVSVTLVLIALPLLIPWNVIGTIWIIFTRPDIGLLGASINGLGIPFDHTASPLDAWITVMLMEVWHWTPLVALLAYVGLTIIRESDIQDKSFTERAPQLGGLVEFYRSPARVAWTPTGTNVPDYPKLAQLWWQNIGEAVAGEVTVDTAMDNLAREQDKVMARIQRSGAQGECGPKLNEKRDPSYWLNQPGAPKAKLANEKPQGETIDYDALIQAWREGRVQ